MDFTLQSDRWNEIEVEESVSDRRYSNQKCRCAHKQERVEVDAEGGLGHQRAKRRENRLLSGFSYIHW